METVGLGFYFEDLPLGRQFKTVGPHGHRARHRQLHQHHRHDRGAVHQPRFLKNEAGFKGRLAPGSLVYCFAEGLLAQSTMQGTGLAFLGMQLDIKGPTFAGDTIHVECEVIESRRSETRPGRGLVRTRNRVVKQDGTLVMEYTPLRMVKCRSETAPMTPARRTLKPTTGPLAGVRVIDLTVNVLGPLATRSWATWAPT